METIIHNKKYGIIGDGRLARHLKHYLTLTGSELCQWSRKQNKASELQEILQPCSIILVLISDDAIHDFISSHKESLDKKIWIHASGSVVTPLAQGIHFLSTFGPNLYDFETYSQIPAFVERGPHRFRDLFPTLKNPNYEMKAEHKALYHALCVLSGNFTTLLWQKFFNELEMKFNIPRSAAYPYLKQVCQNLMQVQNAVTGPFARGDKATIVRNLEALSDDAYKDVYASFLKAFNPRLESEVYRELCH